ncbi:MAG: HAD family hydrolase [Polynucleobacter sp.]|nr:MAG: HAD family hydrolase [Polynucleobacter sp.]
MTSSMPPPLFKGVFFDLDGTLADTAPDLVAAANLLRQSRQLAALPFEELRPKASAGARGLIEGAFGYSPDHPDFLMLRDEFLSNYEKNICVNSRLFDGIEELLQTFEDHQLAWGIVTNKIERFTVPLLKLMGISDRSHANVSGDTTPHAKPHPAPILKAAEICGIDPSVCIYVGDDLRDIEAGKAAGMKTVAAAYGYCGCDEPISDWGADYIIHHPLELNQIIFAKP